MRRAPTRRFARARTRRRAAGFTLVELLLAVTLLALLMAMAYGGFRAATRATASGQDMLEDTGRLRITHQFIRRQLNQMLPLHFDMGESEDGEVVMFLGAERRIQYVAPMPGYLGQGGPQVQVMEVVDGPEGLALVFSHALLQEFSPDRLDDRDPVVLLEGLDHAVFEYLGLDEEGLVGEWTSFWEQPDALPLAVRLDLDLGQESRVEWPLLATGVRVDESSVRQTSEVRDYSETIRELIRKREDQQQ